MAERTRPWTWPRRGATALAALGTFLAVGHAGGQEPPPGRDPQAKAPPIDPLSELARLGDAMVDSAPEPDGSIRAGRPLAGEGEAAQPDPHLLQARVDAVKTGSFPNVALRVTVLRPAKRGPARAIRIQTSLVVVPRLRMQGAQADMNDPATRTNAGAYYIKVGDHVTLRLGERPGSFWIADQIERR